MGVYTPTTGTGTYVTCVGQGGTLDASYWEGDVYAEAAPAIWNSSEGMIQDIGPAALPQCTVETAARGNALKIPAGTVYEHCIPAPKTKARVWGNLSSDNGVVTLTRYVKPETLTVTCTLGKTRYISQKTGKVTSGGIISTCQFPGATLTFAPWGVVQG